MQAPPPPAWPRGQTNRGGVRARCCRLPTVAVTATAAAAALACGGARVGCAITSVARVVCEPCERPSPPAWPRGRTDSGGVRARCCRLTSVAVTGTAAAAALACSGAGVGCADMGKGCTGGGIRSPPPHRGRDGAAAPSPAHFCRLSPPPCARCPHRREICLFWLQRTHPCSLDTGTSTSSSP